jgi:hypothetical protein
MKAPRREGDFYPTPQDVADRIVRSVDRHDLIMPGARVLEPSAGDGAFVRAVRERQPEAKIMAVEPDPRHRHTLAEFTMHVWPHSLEEFTHTREACYDLVIGNPPYNLAAEHVRLCLDLLAPQGRLVFLLRLGFLASKGRRKLFAEHPPERVDVLAERPSFSWTWTCPACETKFTTLPGAHFETCPNPACAWPAATPFNGERWACTKTDAHDYAVITWRQGFEGETAMGWL